MASKIKTEYFFKKPRVPKRSQEDVFKMAFLENCLNKEIEKFGPRSVMLEVEDDEFLADKVILSSHSEYFRVMFSGSYVERNLKRIRINMVRKKDFKLFMDFINDDVLHWSEVNSDNMIRIFEAASMMELKRFIKACEQRLIEDWESFGNASEIYLLAKKYGFESLGVHMLELLAKCMDIGSQVWFNETFYETRLEQCVYSEEVNYEYLIDCLKETTTKDKLRLGPPDKDYLANDRDTMESKALLEWVFRWIANCIVESCYECPLQNEKIMELLVICDFKHLLFEEVEETLNICVSLIDETSRTLVKSILSEVITEQRNIIASNLEKAGLEFLIFGVSCAEGSIKSGKNVKPNDLTPSIRCNPPNSQNSKYDFFDFDIQLNHNDFEVVGCKDEKCFLFVRNLKIFYTVDMLTKEMTLLTEFRRDLVLVTSTMHDENIYCFCYPRNMDYYDYYNYDDVEVSALIATYNLKSGSWTLDIIDMRERCYFHQSNLVYLNGYLYIVQTGKDNNRSDKLYLYRFDFSKKELIRSNNIKWDSNFTRFRIRLAVYKNCLVIFSWNDVVVVNTDTFTDYTQYLIKRFQLDTNDWQVLDVVSKGEKVFVVTKHPSSSPQLCIGKLHISEFDVSNGKLKGIGFMENVYSSHICQKLSRYAKSQLIFI